ncbi:ABC transporter substrate-binding protein [Saccharopolyspora pogona]|uniref:ABC transporter substrate-binding protein n=1 Tax=Saccharopolyspora pogona TaxID=333966 RepID=UPI001683E924|nr:sugar ABC transporter substrate-binding protein [Saccharopolyspora pogona]
MTSRILRRIAAAVVGLVAVAGCAAAPQGNEPETISFLNPHPGAYDAVIAEFERRNPDIRVEQQSVPFDQLVSQTQARLASGDTSIDVVSVDPPRLAGMVAQGFLTDESAARPELEAEVSAVGINSVTVDGKPRAYPLWTSDNFLLYNRDALAKAGVAIPGPKAPDRLTWEQVLAGAQRVVDSGAARYGFGIDQVDRYYSMQPILMSMGAGAGLEGPDNLAAAVNTDAWKRFGHWYGSLYSEGLAPRGVEPSQMADLFVSGQVAFYLTGASSISKIAKSGLAGRWGIAPVPNFQGGPIVTPTDSWGVGISAFSEKQDAARRFAQFVTLDPAGSALASQKLNLPPVNKAAFPAYLKYLAKVAPDATASVGDLLATDARYAQRRPISVGYVQFETTMNKAFTDIRKGGDVNAVLDTAQNTLTRQLSRQREIAGDR